MKPRTDAIPCTSLVAEGAFRGAMLGTIWGAVSDLDLIESLVNNHEMPQHASRVLRRANAMAYSGTAFALFIGVFSAGSCLAERATGQGKEEWFPSFAGGFLGGSLFAVKSRNVWTCVGIGTLTGSFAGLVKYVHAH